MDYQSQPLVSVVTPAYNEEEHLAECIESILAQTYQNWDYTIVNNCSTDKTLEIARSYAAKDPRIRVGNNEGFLPMLANFNSAIRRISPSSKYCKMVLADDWIYPRCLEKMVEVAEAHPSVGLISAYEKCGEEVRITGLPQTQILVSGQEASRQFLMDKLLLFGSQNSVMYRADLVRARNPFYVETEMFADFESALALLRLCDLGFVHEILTFSRRRPRSAGAVSSDLGVQHGSSLNLLFTYGRECLSAAELAESVERELSRYYQFLGRRMFVERKREFWSYHKKTLTKLGVGFSRSRLARASITQLFAFITHPKSTLQSFERLFALMKIRTSETRNLVSNFTSNPVNDVKDAAPRP